MSRNDDIRHLQERIAHLEQAFQMLFDDKAGSGLPFVQRQYEISNNLDYLSSEISALQRALQALMRSEQEHHIQTLDLLASMASELETASGAITRLIPITVFLDTQDGKTVAEVQAAIRQVIAEANWELSFEGEGIPGSWFGRFFARSKMALTSEQVRAELGRLQRSIEMQALDQSSAQVRAEQSEGIAKLIAALADTQDALIQIESVLLLKVDGVLTVRNLTRVELAHLEHNKQLYKAPKDMLEELTRISVKPGAKLPPSSDENKVIPDPRSVLPSS